LKAEEEFHFRDAIRYSEKYIEAHPHDIEGLNRLVVNASVLRDRQPVVKHLEQIRRVVSDDPLALNALLNNLLFVGLEAEALALARNSVARFPEHAYILYQSHRVYLWNGLVDEGRALLNDLLRSDFARDSLQLAILRQACAENDTAAAGNIAAQVLGADELDLSLSYIALQIMSRPEDAHQLLIDAQLDMRGLFSFMNYPYFNHTYFPEVKRMLEEQSAERPFIDGPPYRCTTT
jgi:hypothetical protein